MSSAGVGVHGLVAAVFEYALIVGVTYWAWSSSTKVLKDVRERHKDKESKRALRFYSSRRLYLPNARAARLTQLLASVTYVSVLSYGHLFVMSENLTPEIVVGIMLVYLFVALAGWSTIGTLVPLMEKLLLDYMAILSIGMYLCTVLVVNFCATFGLVSLNNFYPHILAYISLLFMEDVPARCPAIALASLSHGLHHIRTALLWNEPSSLVTTLFTYASLGVLVPFVLSNVLSKNMAWKIPTKVFFALSAWVHGILVVDMLLSTRSFVEPLQDSWRDISEGSHSVLRHLMYRGSANSLQPYLYGLRPVFGTGGMAVCLWSIVLCSLANSVMEEPEQDAPRPAWVTSLSQVPAVASFMRTVYQLSENKKACVCGILISLNLQGAAILYTASQAVLHGKEGLVTSAPSALLLLLLGVVLEVVAGMYVVAPAPAERSHSTAYIIEDDVSVRSGDTRVTKSIDHNTVASEPIEPGKREEIVSRLDQRRRSLSADNVNLLASRFGQGHAVENPALIRSHGMPEDVQSVISNSSAAPLKPPFDHLDTYIGSNGSVLSRLPQEDHRGLVHTDLHGQEEGHGSSSQDMALRLDSLNGFKTFMKGLDTMPAAYTLDEFIRGAANAIKGVFPGVHHASFCLLSSGRASVNMYTFIGDGVQKPPQINVTVSPGTMIYHVLNTCKPVFVNDITTFSGNGPDIQFMRFVLGLNCIACLPLFVANQRILGVLRLGFAEPRGWPEQERGIATQLAIVLSSTSHNLGGGGGASSFTSSSNLDSQYMSSTSIPTGDRPPGSLPLGRFDVGGAAEEPVGFKQDHSQPVYVMSGSTRGPGLVDGPPRSARVPGDAGIQQQQQVPYSSSPGSRPPTSRPDAVQQQYQQHPYPCHGSRPPGSRPEIVRGDGVDYGMNHPHTSQPHPTTTSRPPGSRPDHIAGYREISDDTAYPLTYSNRPPSSRPDLGYRDGSEASYPGRYSNRPPGSRPESVRRDPSNSSLQQQQQLIHGSRPEGSVRRDPSNSSLQQYQQVMQGSQTRPHAVRRDPSSSSLQQQQQQVMMHSGRGTGRPESVARDPSTSSLQPSINAFRRGPTAVSSFTGSVWSFDEGAAEVVQEVEPTEQSMTDIKMMEIIGRGGFGSVFKAFFKGKLCAVKVLEHGEDLMGFSDGKSTTKTKGGEDASGRRAALMEGAISTTINHPNVVQTHDFRVINLSPQGRGPGMPTNRVVQETHIIMEFCDRGSMQDAMEQNVFALDDGGRAGGLDMDLVVMTLAEVAAAMDFLHQHRITHRDLKPKNILLKSSTKDRRGFCAKVSDFGLSQVLPDATDGRTMVSTKYSGTVTHMPPELIEDGKVYQQGDVYAFGIIMWEIYTGTVPYAHMAHPQIMVAVVSHNMRPKFPDGCPEWYKSLAAKCWRKDPKSRPSFEEIAQYLETMVSERSWRAVGDK